MSVVPELTHDAHSTITPLPWAHLLFLVGPVSWTAVSTKGYSGRAMGNQEQAGNVLLGYIGKYLNP